MENPRRFHGSAGTFDGTSYEATVINAEKRERRAAELQNIRGRTPEQEDELIQLKLAANTRGDIQTQAETRLAEIETQRATEAQQAVEAKAAQAVSLEEADDLGDFDASILDG